MWIAVIRKVSLKFQHLAALSVRHKPRALLAVSCACPVYNLIHRIIHSQPTGLYTSSRQGSQQVRVILAHALLRAPPLLDPLARVQHRGVITAAERITDLWEAVTRQLLGQGHRHLAWTCHG